MSAWLVDDRPYPSRPKLSQTDELRVLHSGPDPRYFRPFAEHAHARPRRAPHPWGLIHIHGEWGEPPVWEVVGYWSSDDLRWALQVLFEQDHDWDYWRDLDGIFNEHECHGVFWWEPTDPNLLPLPLGVTA